MGTDRDRTSEQKRHKRDQRIDLETGAESPDELKNTSRKTDINKKGDENGVPVDRPNPQPVVNSGIAD